MKYIDFWGQKEPQNEFYSSSLVIIQKGLEYEKRGISRRDPSSIIKVNGLYYVYYTRQRSGPPVDIKMLLKNPQYMGFMDIYCATSKRYD